MKFGAEINSRTKEPWKSSYIQYDILKSKLKQDSWSEEDKSDFAALIEAELAKVYKFVQIRLQDLLTRTDYCDSVLKEYKDLSTIQPNTYDSVADSLAEILIDVDDLAKFHELNLSGFDKIVKKHDKWLAGGNLKTQYYGSMLETYPLDKQRFDVLIVRISKMHDICRLSGNARSTSAYSQGGDQTAFERATNKYWVHPDHITEVKAMILLHLPVHVFNQKKDYEYTDAAVSSVYYDNEDFELYQERLERSKGAEAIRIRWYGQSNELNDDVYIERKTHHAAWLDDKSVKDRFRLKESQVNAFIDGSYSADDFKKELEKKGKMDPISIEDKHFVCKGIQESIKQKGLKPMCRVFYNRTAFQFPGDQRLRISLDSNLSFIREDHLDGTARRQLSDGKFNWRRPDIGIDHPFRNLKDSDILRFPYAILETKIQSHLGQTIPLWLSDLLDSHLVHEVPRFSKYIHGASQLFNSKVYTKPYWLEALHQDIRKPFTLNVGLSRSQSFKPLFNGRHRRSVAYDTMDEPTKTKEDEPTKRHQQFDKLFSPFRSRPNNKQKSDIPYLAINLSNNPIPPSKDKKSSDLISKFWSVNKFSDGVKNTDSDFSRRRKGGFKMDPKAFFANERTFMSWLQFCALLLTISLNLLNYGDRISRLVGAFFICISALISL